MALKDYEIVMVFSLSKGEEAVNALKTKFTDLISKNGTLGEVEEWGKKKLAYEVQKMKEAFYYFIRFEAESTVPAEIESRVRIMDNVIRYLCVRQDEA